MLNIEFLVRRWHDVPRKFRAKSSRDILSIVWLSSEYHDRSTTAIFQKFLPEGSNGLNIAIVVRPRYSRFFLTRRFERVEYRDRTIAIFEVFLTRRFEWFEYRDRWSRYSRFFSPEGSNGEYRDRTIATLWFFSPEGSNGLNIAIDDRDIRGFSHPKVRRASIAIIRSRYSGFSHPKVRRSVDWDRSSPKLGPNLQFWPGNVKSIYGSYDSCFLVFLSVVFQLFLAIFSGGLVRHHTVRTKPPANVRIFVFIIWNFFRV